MTWFSKDMGDGVEALLPLRQLKSDFDSAFAAAGRPSGVAVHVLHRNDGVHCCVTVYFSPAAHLFAVTLGAQPCAVPTNVSRLEFLAGDRTGF